MKNYILPIIFSYFPFLLFSQLPDVKFTTFTPRWIHIIQDTNFIPGSNEYFNSFSSLYPAFNPEVEEDFSYIPFTCNNGNYERDGAILVKIQNEDGQILWKKFMNTSNEDDQNYYTSFFNEDKIYYAGRKRTQKSVELNEEWQIGGYSKPFYRVIDKSSGFIEQEIFDEKDSIGHFLGFIIKVMFPMNQKMRQIERTNLGVIVSDVEENTVHISQSQLLPYPSPIQAGLGFKTRALFIKEDARHCNVYFHSVSKDTLLHPHIGRLDYYVSENDSFRLQRSVDFSKYIKTVPTSGIRDRFYSKYSQTGSMVITQTYQEDEYPNFRSWLLKLNPLGEVISHVEYIKLIDQNHSYEVGIPFYVDDNNVLLMGYPSVTGESGVDIIQIKNNSEVVLKGHITTGDTTKMGIGGIDMNQNGDIVFSFQWEQQYSGMMGMHISDFGINLSSNDGEKPKPSPLITLSPNPTSDEVVLHIKDVQYHEGTVLMYNMSGQKVAQQKISHGEKLDIRNLNSGQYIIQYNPDNRPGYYLTTNLVKK